MSDEHLVLVGLVILLVVFGGRLLAGRLRLPDAVVLVVLGVAVSFVPGVDDLHVSPDVILLLFLPPLIYNAAFFSSPRDMRSEARPIIALAVLTTLVSAFAVAGVIHLVLPHAGWPAAIAVGAAVAPTDAVASAAILKRIGAPRRVLTRLEGESLINDGVALTLFSLAVTAMMTPLSVADGVLELLRVVVGGLLFGGLIAVAVTWARKRFGDANAQLVLSLMTPFVAYVPAEALGFSGVLSAVVAGFYLGTHGEGLLPPAVRVTGTTIWRGLVMLLESTLFVLLGLQLHEVFAAVAGVPLPRLVIGAAAVLATAVAVRLLWELAVPWLLRMAPGRLRVPPESARFQIVIGWSGMRGAISLAIALSLPVTVNGAPFTDRSLLLFFAAVVVLGTLIGQGTTLPWVLRKTGLAGGEDRDREYALAKEAMGRAGLARLDEMLDDEDLEPEQTDPVRRRLAEGVRQARRHLEHLDAGSADRDGLRQQLHDVAYVKTEVRTAQRTTVDRLYREGEIGYETLQRIRRQLDLTEPPEQPPAQ
ncbi:Na+/H+ antiporter [Nocardiopsis coralliicola]